MSFADAGLWEGVGRWIARRQGEEGDGDGEYHDLHTWRTQRSTKANSSGSWPLATEETV